MFSQNEEKALGRQMSPIEHMRQAERSFVFFTSLNSVLEEKRETGRCLWVPNVKCVSSDLESQEYLISLIWALN